ncbi:uncharacterized protein LOC116425084 [Nomia melanderi]|uniref:uncharacterized protein LOC116425084 n=1 Tax=Nomia melanderi TaxID=2448451 RepID=UPI003FCE1279
MDPSFLDVAANDSIQQNDNCKMENLTQSYLELKKKICKTHEVIKQYNDKLKECERLKSDLDAATKQTRKVTCNYNSSLAKVIKLELQNTEYKKNIETLTAEVNDHKIKAAADHQHIQQLVCKIKDVESHHNDLIMQHDLKKSTLEMKVKELDQELKNVKKMYDMKIKKMERKPTTENNSIHKSNSSINNDSTINICNKPKMIDVGTVTILSKDEIIQKPQVTNKCIITDEFYSIKDDMYPIFCAKCEVRIEPTPLEKICKIMTESCPKLVEQIPSPPKKMLPPPILPSSSNTITERSESESLIALPETPPPCIPNQINHSEFISPNHLPPQASVESTRSNYSNFPPAPSFINPTYIGSTPVNSVSVVKSRTSQSTHCDEISMVAPSLSIISSLQKRVNALEKKLKKKLNERKVEQNSNCCQHSNPHYMYDINNSIQVNFMQLWQRITDLYDSKTKQQHIVNKRRNRTWNKCKLSRLKSTKRLQDARAGNTWKVETLTKKVEPSSVRKRPKKRKYRHSMLLNKPEVPIEISEDLEELDNDPDSNSFSDSFNDTADIAVDASINSQNESCLETTSSACNNDLQMLTCPQSMDVDEPETVDAPKNSAECNKSVNGETDSGILSDSVESSKLVQLEADLDVCFVPKESKNLEDQSSESSVPCFTENSSSTIFETAEKPSTKNSKSTIFESVGKSSTANTNSTIFESVEKSFTKNSSSTITDSVEKISSENSNSKISKLAKRSSTGNLKSTTSELAKKSSTGNLNSTSDLAEKTSIQNSSSKISKLAKKSSTGNLNSTMSELAEKTSTQNSSSKISKLAKKSSTGNLNSTMSGLAEKTSTQNSNSTITDSAEKYSTENLNLTRSESAEKISYENPSPKISNLTKKSSTGNLNSTMSKLAEKTSTQDSSSTISELGEKTTTKNLNLMMSDLAEKSSTDYLSSMISEFTERSPAENLNSMMSELAEKSFTENSNLMMSESTGKSSTEKLNSTMSELTEKSPIENLNLMMSDLAEKCSTKNLNSTMFELAGRSPTKNLNLMESKFAEKSSIEDLNSMMSELTEKSSTKKSNSTMSELTEKSSTKNLNSTMSELAEKCSTNNLNSTMSELAERSPIRNLNLVISKLVEKSSTKKSNSTMSELTERSPIKNLNLMISKLVEKSSTKKSNSTMSDLTEKSSTKKSNSTMSDLTEKSSTKKSNVMISELAEKSSTEKSNVMMSELAEKSPAENSNLMMTELAEKSSTENSNLMISELTEKSSTEMITPDIVTEEVTELEMSRTTEETDDVEIIDSVSEIKTPTSRNVNPTRKRKINELQETKKCTRQQLLKKIRNLRKCSTIPNTRPSTSNHHEIGQNRNKSSHALQVEDQLEKEVEDVKEDDYIPKKKPRIAHVPKATVTEQNVSLNNCVQATVCAGENLANKKENLETVANNLIDPNRSPIIKLTKLPLKNRINLYEQPITPTVVKESNQELKDKCNNSTNKPNLTPLSIARPDVAPVAETNNDNKVLTSDTECAPEYNSKVKDLFGDDSDSSEDFDSPQSPDDPSGVSVEVNRTDPKLTEECDFDSPQSPDDSFGKSVEVNKTDPKLTEECDFDSPQSPDDPFGKSVEVNKTDSKLSEECDFDSPQSPDDPSGVSVEVNKTDSKLTEECDFDSPQSPDDPCGVSVEVNKTDSKLTEECDFDSPQSPDDPFGKSVEVNKKDPKLTEEYDFNSPQSPNDPFGVSVEVNKTDSKLTEECDFDFPQSPDDLFGKSVEVNKADPKLTEECDFDSPQSPDDPFGKSVEVNKADPKLTEECDFDSPQSPDDPFGKSVEVNKMDPKLTEECDFDSPQSPDNPFGKSVEVNKADPKLTEECDFDSPQSPDDPFGKSVEVNKMDPKLTEECDFDSPQSPDNPFGKSVEVNKTDSKLTEEYGQLKRKNETNLSGSDKPVVSIHNIKNKVNSQAKCKKNDKFNEPSTVNVILTNNLQSQHCQDNNNQFRKSTNVKHKLTVSRKKVQKVVNNDESFNSNNLTSNNVQQSKVNEMTCTTERKLNSQLPIEILKEFNKNSTINRNYKKELEQLEKIRSEADKSVVKQLHRIIHSEWQDALHWDVIEKLKSTYTPRIIAKNIVDYLSVTQKVNKNLDNTYTPPAPLMTKVQQRIVALLADLEESFPIIQLVQGAIEYKLFKFNQQVQKSVVELLARVYIILAKIKKDRQKVRIFCCDALYCMGLSGILVLYTVFTCWPESFPKNETNNDLLPKCIAHLLLAQQAVNYPKLFALKNLVTLYYKYPSGTLSANILKELLTALQEKCHPDVEASIKLLAKKEGMEWTYKNIIKGALLPMIINEKLPDMYRAFGLLGDLMRVFPIEDKDNSVGEIVEQLCDLISSGEGTDEQQEGVISALLSLSRHKFDTVLSNVTNWTPTVPLHDRTVEQIRGMFNQRDPTFWRGYLKKYEISKTGKRSKT